MKVSVLIITYNHENFIHQAVESALAQQTDFDYEIVIGEDCSTDNTREILLHLKAHHPEKIKLFLPQQNLGANKNYVEVHRLCQGQYIASLEGDDYWTCPYKLQKQVNYLEKHQECSMVFHNTRHFHASSPEHDFDSKPPREKSIFSLEDLYLGNFIPTCSVLYRKGLFGDFPNWFTDLSGGDLGLLFLNANHGKIGYIDEVMGATRVHKGGAWNGASALKQISSVIHDLEILRDNLKFLDNQVLSGQISELNFSLAMEYKKHKKNLQSKHLVLKSIFQRPINPYISLVRRLKLLASPFS